MLYSQQFKPEVGQKVFIHLGGYTRMHYGLTTEMETKIGTIQVIKKIQDSQIFIDNDMWCLEDLCCFSPEDEKKIEVVLEKVDKINAVIPELISWIEDAEKLYNKGGIGLYNSKYGVYTATKGIESSNYFTGDRSCFGALPKLIKEYYEEYFYLPNRVQYNPNFKNDRFLSNPNMWLKDGEIQRWIILCKKYGMLPIYIKPDDFLNRKVTIKINNKLCYDKLFFYLLNARYCDECPVLVKMIIYFIDTVGLNFYVSYVLSHFMVEKYDEEHGALPAVKHIKEEIKTYNKNYDEFYTHIIYHKPRPRDVIMWSLGICAFANKYSGLPIVDQTKKFPEGIPWRLHYNIQNLQPRFWELSLRATNKSYNILKTFNPKTSKMRKKT